MIILLAASSIYLSGLQGAIAAPTSAFRGCLHDAAAKAKTDKVTGAGIEDYLKKACTVQMGSLSEALIAFRMKNGMTRKAAASDAAMTVDDYISSPVDSYKFTAAQEAKQAAASAPTAPIAKSAAVPAAAVPSATPVTATPASQPTKP